jgi:hypothetical protein
LESGGRSAGRQVKGRFVSDYEKHDKIDLQKAHIKKAALRYAKKRRNRKIEMKALQVVKIAQSRENYFRRRSGVLDELPTRA